MVADQREKGLTLNREWAAWVKGVRERFPGRWGAEVHVVYEGLRLLRDALDLEASHAKDPPVRQSDLAKLREDVRRQILAEFEAWKAQRK